MSCAAGARNEMETKKDAMDDNIIGPGLHPDGLWPIDESGAAAAVKRLFDAICIGDLEEERVPAALRALADELDASDPPAMDLSSRSSTL